MQSFICLVLSPHSIPTLPDAAIQNGRRSQNGGWEQRPEPLSDDFLFSMSSSTENCRLSYASSPESDLEVSPPPAPRLVKSSSDPSIATTQDNMDRDDDMNHMADAVPPPYTVGISNFIKHLACIDRVCIFLLSSPIFCFNAKYVFYNLK